MSEFKKTVLSGVLWLGSATAISQLITWIFTLLIARLLTPEDYGIYAFVGVYIGLLEFLNEFGIGATIVQRQSISKKEIAGLFAFSLYLSVVLCAATFIFAQEISQALHGPELVPILQLLSISFVISAFKNIQRSLMTRELRFQEIAKVDALCKITTSALSYGLAIYGFGVWTLAIAYLVFSFSQAVCYSLLQRASFAFFPKFGMLKEHLRFGFKILVSRLMGAISGRVQTMVIGRLIGVELLGIYSFSQVLAFKPVDTFTSVLNQVLFPLYSRLQSDRKARNSYVMRVLEIELLVMMPIACLMALTADMLVPLILGEKWMMLVPFLRVFSILGVFIFLSNQTTMLLISAGNVRLQIWFEMASFFLLTTSFYVLTRDSDYSGILLGWSVIYPSISVIYFVMMLRALHISLADVARRFYLPLGTAIVMSVFVGILKQFYAIPTWGNLSALLFAGIVSLLLALYCMGRERFYEVFRIIRGATYAG